MAAPSGTVWGSIAGGYGRIGIYVELKNTATTTTATAEVWFWSKYSVSDSNNTYKFDFLSSDSDATSVVDIGSINTTVATGDGWSTSNQIKLKTHTSTEYTRGTTSVTKYASAGLSDVDRVGSKMRARVSFTIPKLDSYTVSYKANGGSGAPSSQTKWYGKTLTLSSTKPTKTGHSFQGWATSASGAVAYSAGGSYTANSAVTLYAVWKANTYAVKYNANGGSLGNVSNQTKTYGVELKLDADKPTRTNYTFKGWGTSASATTVAYAAGATYTKNAAITLYAIWELAYVKPRINNFSVKRCDSAGTLNDEGTYALVKFDWACDKTVTSIKIERKLTSGSTWTSETVSSSGTSGSVSKVIGAGDISADNTYNIRITVADGTAASNTSTKTGILEGTHFVIDLKSGGDGIAFGKPAEESGYMDVGYKSRFRDSMYVNASLCLGNDWNIRGRTTEAAGGSDIALLGVSSSNNTVLGYGGYNNNIGATNIYGNAVNVYSKGNVNVKSPLHLDVTTDASGTEDKNPALTIGPAAGSHLEFDQNEIMAKASGTTTGPLYINTNGGDVGIGNKNSGVSLNGTVTVNGYKMATNTVLWSGAWYMSDAHTVELEENISEQANGVVLVWSYYENGAAQNYSWNTTFIPKHLISVAGGTGMSVFLTTATANSVTPKYLYIYDEKIVGYTKRNDDGTDSGVGNAGPERTTTSGMTVIPRAFVLRYVIGV